MKNINLKNNIFIVLSLTAILVSSCNEGNKTSGENHSNHSINTDSINYPNIIINPSIIKDSINNKIIDRVKDFLKIKNENKRSIEFWNKSDFDRYMFPYSDLNSIERKNDALYYYKPNILEIIEISDTEYIIKIAFIGEGVLKCVYNMIIDLTDFKFKRILIYNTKNWDIKRVGNIEYFISPLKKPFNQQQALRMNSFNEKLAVLFEMEPRKITYYSCLNPKEIFEIIGFDYITNMYLSETGGLSETYSNIIYSGNNSELYEHEIVHNYLHRKFFKTIQHLPLIDEGLSTYLGGSGNIPYTELRRRLQKFLETNDDINIDRYLYPYSNDEVKNELSYTIGALLCEISIKKFGDKGFLDIFHAKNIDEVIDFLDLNKVRLKQQLLEELSTPLEILDF